MILTMWRNGLGATLAAMTLLAGQVCADTNSAGASLPAKGKYAPLNELPDWSGVWDNVSGYDFGTTLGEPANPAPYKPEYAAKVAEAERLSEAAIAAGVSPPEPEGNSCRWPGMPLLDLYPYGLEFLFTPGRVTMLWTILSSSRRIYTDGRKFPDDLDESYNGLSIGHWEGDTLVVHTKGLRDNSKETLGTFFSNAMEIDERWRLIAPNRMMLEITMTDPKVFTRPWVARRYYVRHPDWDIGEYNCDENNRLKE